MDNDYARILQDSNDNICLFFSKASPRIELKLVVNGTEGTRPSCGEAEAGLVKDAYMHLAATYSPPYARIYVNGVLVSEKTDWPVWPPWDGNITYTETDRYTVSSETYPLKGTVDEIRLSNICRTTSWIQTCYNNQASPETFYSVELILP